VIASATIVISTFGRDLKRIPDQSLALLEMPEREVSIIPLLWTSQNESFELASAALRGGFILRSDIGFKAYTSAKAVTEFPALDYREREFEGSERSSEGLEVVGPTANYRTEVKDINPA